MTQSPVRASRLLTFLPYTAVRCQPLNPAVCHEGRHKGPKFCEDSDRGLERYETSLTKYMRFQVMLRRMLLISVHGYLLYCGVAGALDVYDNDVINTIFNKYFEGGREKDISFIFFL